MVGRVVERSSALLELARDASRREDWPAASSAFAGTDPDGLDAIDLEAYADATWWTGDLRTSIAVRQKAYVAQAAAGNERAAAADAGRLAVEHFVRGEGSVGGGWLARARRHLGDEAECPELAFVVLIEAMVVRFGGDAEGSVELSRRAADIAKRTGDRNLLGMAIHSEGLAHIAAGRVPQGVALLDDAMTSVLAGELNAYFTGVVYCNVIDACLQLVDLRRAGEWAAAAKVWCEALPPGSLYPGMCRVNRAELARLNGAWPEAEEEAERAAQEMEPIEPEIAGNAFYELGEVRRRRGDLAGAERSFQRAVALGASAQPGLALTQLAQGKITAAAAGLRAVDETAMAPPRRAGVLAAGVRVAVAGRDLDQARRYASELEALTEGLASVALEAAAAEARGEVLLAEGDAEAAGGAFRRACSLWQAVKLPYEAARGRALCGEALRALGDVEAGALELRAALETFERLGATADAVAIVTSLGASPQLPRGLTPREVEVLRLVAAGKTNRDIAVELVISEHTVGRHLQNLYAKLDVSTRAAATAFAFEHDLA
jgi:ATP/maltotriose-dependent transcriptional regulator MalT